MSLSITISNINDLTDAERAVLQTVLRQWEPKAGVAVGWTPIDPSLAATVIPAAPSGDDGGLSGDFMRHNEPPPAPETPASATSAHASAIVGTSAELDANGPPWDKRIHSSNRAKVADGRWRYARNVHPALITEVEAELRSVQAIPAPVPSMPRIDPACGEPFEHKAIPTPVSMTPDEEFVGTVPSILTEAQNIPVVPPVPPAPVPAAPLTFADLMKHVTPMLVSGKLPQDTLLAVTAEFGLPHLTALGARPDLVEAVRARIDEVCK